MAASCEKLDQLVKDYLLFRGFSGTLKTLDQELKTDKDKGLRVDRIMEQIWTLLSGYDLQGLREYWQYLNQRLFSRLEQRYSQSVGKLESSLLKLYIVNAHQCGKQDKVLAFFEQVGPEIQSHPDFKDWFAFPFVSNPADNSAFSIYFNKQWQDTLQLSLHNFLSVVLQAMPVPTLLNVEFDARRMKTLHEENTSLKTQLKSTSFGTDVRDSRSGTRRSLHSELHPPSSPPDMVYDFSGLASDTDPPNQEKQKTTRRFPLSLTSPLASRKKSEPSQSKLKASTTTASAASTSTSGSQGKQPKTTEMSVFPPVTRVGRGPNPSATSTSSSSSASASAGTAGTSKNPQNKPGSTVPARGSPVPMTSMAPPSTSDSSTLAPLARRSQSVIEPKVTNAAKLKPSLSKPGSETQLFSSIAPPSGGSHDSSGTKFGSSGDSEYSDSMFGGDTNSPFLLLEDEYMEHSSTTSFCRFSLTGQYVASLDIDGIVKVWMWSPQPATTATVMSRSAFVSLAWASKSDRWLLLGNKTGTIRLFDVKESKTYREVLVDPDSPANCMRVNDLSTSPSSMQFVCATSDECPFTSDLSTVSGRLLQWDLRTLKLERALLVDSTVCNAITCSAYNQSGHLLVTGGADGFIRIYDAMQQKPVQKWHGHDSPIHTVQFVGDKSVFSMSADGKLCEWSLTKTGELLSSLRCGPCEFGKVTTGSCRGHLFSLDYNYNHLLTYNGRRGSIYQVSGVQSPTRIMELKSHISPVVTVDWSPSQDTRVCLTGSTDGKIKISTLLAK